MSLNNVTIRNNSFYNNRHGIEFVSNVLDNLKIINNSLFNFGSNGRGIYFIGNLTNTIIINNAIDGDGESSTTGVRVNGNYNSGTLDYNNIFDIDTDYNIGGGVVSPGGNNIDVSPKFYIDGINLKIQGDSGNIDKGAGNGTYSDVPIDDLYDISRPIDIPEMNDVDDGTDIGAIEFDPPEYYMDEAQTGSGHTGTQGDPWSKADFDTWHAQGGSRKPGGEIIRVKGEFSFTGMTSTQIHYFIDKWENDDDPWIFRFTSGATMFSGSFPRNGIISVDMPSFSFAFLDPPTQLDTEEVLNCILLVNADTTFSTLYANFKGCTIVSNVNFDHAASSIFTDCVFDLLSMSDTVSTFNNCAFNLSSLGGNVTANDCQLNWTPPTWPAYNGTKSEWNIETLVSNLNEPPQPGNSPYTGYSTGLWGEIRFGIGGFSFELSGVYFVNANGSGAFPFNTKAKGANNFKDLFDNITQQDGDIIEVTDDAEIDDSGNTVPGITKGIIIRSHSGNTVKPTIKAKNDDTQFMLNADITGLEIKNIKMYKLTPVSGDFIYLFPLSTYTDIEISDCEFWVDAANAGGCLKTGGILVDFKFNNNILRDLQIGILTLSTSITGFEVKNNKFDNISQSIVLSSTGPVDNSEILKNKFYDGPLGGQAIFVQAITDNLKIINNIIYDINSGPNPTIWFFGTTLDNCVIANNSLRNISGINGIRLDISTSITNTIVINNIVHGDSVTIVGIYARNFDSGTLDYNNVYDCTGSSYDVTGSVSAGENSISVDPLFFNTTDLMLQQNSPCIDTGAGNGTHAEVPTDDYREQARPVDIAGVNNTDDGTDMGAFEMLQSELERILFVNANGSNTSPYDTEDKGAITFKNLFDNIVQRSGDIVDVVNDGEIIETTFPGNITVNMIIRSWASNISRPTIKMADGGHFFEFDAASGIIDGLKVQNLIIYKDGSSGATGDLISFRNSIINNYEITGNKFFVITAPTTNVNGVVFDSSNTGSGGLINKNEFINLDRCIRIENDFSNLDIINNVFRDDDKGIRAGDIGMTFDGFNVINNSFYNMVDYAISILPDTLTNTIVVNNIIHGNSNNTFRGMELNGFNSGTLDYNNVFECSTAYQIISSSVTIGPNSISVDPEFVSATDLQIKLFSPCVDQGIDSGTYYKVPSDDFLNRIRPLDIEGISNAADGVDIGAYEIYPVSNLDTGVIVDISSGAVDVVSTIFNNILEAMPSVVANSNFDSASKWNTVVVLYEHANGQNKKMVHKSRNDGWTAREVFSEFSNTGTWEKNKVILLDNEKDVLVIDRAELGAGEDISVTT